jgi:hypothetical protein
MTQKILIPALGIVLAFVAVSSSQGAVIANYTFAGSSFASTDLEGNSAAGNITKGAGLGANSTFATTPGSDGNPVPSFKFDASDTTTAFSTANNDYIEFIVTANSGFALFLDGATVTFDAKGDTANQHWTVRSSVDTFGSDIGTGDAGNNTFTGETATLSGATFNNLSTITFRIYGWDTDDNRNLFLDNIALNGTVAVPEVGTVWASLLVIGAALIVRRRFAKRQLA